MYTWTFLFAFSVVGLSIEGVPLVLFPLTVLLAVGVLVMMPLPRWRARGEAHGGGRCRRHGAAHRPHAADRCRKPRVGPGRPPPTVTRPMLPALPGPSLTAPGRPSQTLRRGAEHLLVTQ